MLAHEGSASHGQFHSLGYHICWWLPAHRHTGLSRARGGQQGGKRGGGQGQGADVSTTSSSAGSGTVSVTVVTVVPSGCLIDVVVR